MTLVPSSSRGSGGGGGTVTSVTAGDTSIVVGGTATDPTIETGDLDVIATVHPPAAAWSNNGKKITNIANGSSAQDAAAFGQIPTTLPPNGSAGGDLAGAYPNPTIGAGKVTVAKLAAAVTLDAIAAANATAGSVAMNANKITGLANGTAATDALAVGQVIAAGASHPPGYQLDYVPITTPQAISGTTEGGATTIVTGTSQAYDATLKRIAFFCPNMINSGAAGILTYVILRGSTVLGQYVQHTTAAGVGDGGVWFEIEDTPGAATFSYIVKAFNGSSVTATVEAGAGGSGALFPAYLRVLQG